MPSRLHIEILGKLERWGDGVLYPYPMVTGLIFEPCLITVGSWVKNPSPSIVISQLGFSRKHATIYHENAKWYVADAGSDNGTWLVMDGEYTPTDWREPIAINGDALFSFATVAIRLTEIVS
ncbi:MAG: FHA domain-containing protein [Armatimonadetes bacterium]|nr:FHA domain-containing protein [Anaerolineae bacterium]